MEKTNIKKLLLSTAFVAALAPAIPAQAQIDGYFRIQNGIGITNNDHYVWQSDLLYGAPNLKATEASSKAGSVFYIKTVPADENLKMGKGAMRIVSLRSQGVELIGPKLKNIDANLGETDSQDSTWLKYWSNVYRQLLNEPKTTGKALDDYKEMRHKAWRQAGELGYICVGRALIEDFIYNTAFGLANSDSASVTGIIKPGDYQKIKHVTQRFVNECAQYLDIDPYLVPVNGENGAQGYYIKWRPIDWASVARFFRNTDVMNEFEVGLIAMENYMTKNGHPGEDIEPYEVPLLMKLGYNVFRDNADKTYGLSTGTYPVNWRRNTTGTPAKLNYNGTGFTSYECIFTHPYLLYGWVKLNLYKMMKDPSGYKTPITYFGGQQLYDLWEALGKDKLFLSYFCRYPYYNGDELSQGFYKNIYLIDGFLSKNGSLDEATKITDETTPGNKYKALGRFGFRIENFSGNHNDEYDDYSTYDENYSAIAPTQNFTSYTAAEDYYLGKLAKFKNTPSGTVTEAGEGAKWYLRSISSNEDSAFYVQPIMQGRKGNWYTSLYVDFPIDVKKSAAGIHFYAIGNNLKDTTIFNGTHYQFVEVNEITDTVPARQPVIVETTSNEGDACAIVPAAKDGTKKAAPSLLKGVFFNVGKTNAEDTYASADTTNLAKKAEDKAAKVFDYEGLTGLERLAAELNNRYDIAFNRNAENINDPDSVLFTLQKNADDRYNPMGFYHYTGTTLAANKVFFIESKKIAESGAKIFIGVPSGEATGINNVVADEKNKPLVIYDLAGRRVSVPTTGIYIVNGKKVLITK